MLYKKLYLLITEAKKDIELFRALVSALKKRNYMSMVSDIASVPNTGIVRTGDKWFLIRYVLLPPKPAVFISSPITVDGSSENIGRHFLTLLAKLLRAIDLQKRAVDQYGLA